MYLPNIKLIFDIKQTKLCSLLSGNQNSSILKPLITRLSRSSLSFQYISNCFKHIRLMIHWAVSTLYLGVKVGHIFMVAGGWPLLQNFLNCIHL